jgi:hypothetical protein
MKRSKIIAFLLIYVAIACIAIVYLVYAQKSVPVPAGEKDTKVRLTLLENEFNGSLLRSFYSLEELRPYSIIQIDKIAEKYVSGAWLSPEETVNILDEKEKRLLLDKIAFWIDSQGDNYKKMRILDKIKYWCVADGEFNLLNSKMGIFDKNILKAINQTSMTKNFIPQLSEQGHCTKEMTDEQIEKAYIDTYNFICNLPLEDQLKYYSEMFEHLSVACR